MPRKAAKKRSSKKTIAIDVENGIDLFPAHDREYRTGEEAAKDFVGGRDFMLRGEYVSKASFKPGTSVLLRYSRSMLQHLCIVPESKR